MRKFLLALLFLLFVPAAYVAALSRAHVDLGTLPDLKSGDLIFETTLDLQLALPIMVATGSLYTHVGIIHTWPDGHITVVHAAGPVLESRLADYIHEGYGERIAIYRYPGLTDVEREAIVKDAEGYLGRPYNFVFYMPSKTIYCSELPFFSFKAAQRPIGTLQKFGDLSMNNPPVHKLFESRWRMHPACQAKDMTYDACWKEVLNEPIITPISLARDPKLKPIYSNYLF